MCAMPNVRAVAHHKFNERKVEELVPSNVTRIPINLKLKHR